MRSRAARLMTMAMVAAAACLSPTTAEAQRRMPHKDANAVGAEVGVFLPQQDGMSTGLDVAGFFEHYMTARNSLRIGVEYADPKVERETSDSVKQVRVGA